MFEIKENLKLLQVVGDFLSLRSTEKFLKQLFSDYSFVGFDSSFRFFFALTQLLPIITTSANSGGGSVGVDAKYLATSFL